MQSMWRKIFRPAQSAGTCKNSTWNRAAIQMHRKALLRELWVCRSAGRSRQRKARQSQLSALQQRIPGELHQIPHSIGSFEAETGGLWFMRKGVNVKGKSSGTLRNGAPPNGFRMRYLRTNVCIIWRNILHYYSIVYNLFDKF